MALERAALVVPRSLMVAFFGMDAFVMFPSDVVI